jgi:hypothetical protein
MKSLYQSAEHRNIHATKEALREHAIDHNNTGRTPERIIDILDRNNHPDARGLLSRILTGDLTATDRRIIREIPGSEIPAVTPIKAPEEPKRRVKHTPPPKDTFYW